MWIDDFSPTRAGLVLLAAGLIIAGAWSAGSEDPGQTFAKLAGFAVMPLALVMIDFAVRIIADINRCAWERQYWRNKPVIETEAPDPAVIDEPLPAEPGAIPYRVMGKEQAPLARISPADLREAQWRRACVQFLQSGHATGNRWTFRDMKAAGLIEREAWDVIVEVLVGANLATADPGRGTWPYPDYTSALTRLRAGCPLPFPDQDPPRLARVHNTAQHNTGCTSSTEGAAL